MAYYNPASFSQNDTNSIMIMLPPGNSTTQPYPLDYSVSLYDKDGNSELLYTTRIELNQEPDYYTVNYNRNSAYISVMCSRYGYHRGDDPTSKRYPESESDYLVYEEDYEYFYYGDFYCKIAYEDWKGGGIDRVVHIVDYQGSSSTIRVPSYITYDSTDLPVTYLDAWSFSNWDITTLTLPGHTNIHPTAFEGSDVDTLTYTEDTTHISASFSSYMSPVNLVIPNNVANINSWYSASRLETVTLSDNITYIPSMTFGSCYALKCVRIGARIDDIRDAAFHECPNLTDVYYNMLSSTYYRMRNEGKFTVGSENTYFNNANKHFKVDMKIKINGSLKTITDCYVVGPSNTKQSVIDIPTI